MIERDFHVSRTVGSGQSRHADVVRVRKALRKTGHSRPASRPSGTYDRSVHDAVVGFQHDFGLKEDGIIQPGGPTQSTINVAHAALEAGGREGLEAIREPFAALHEDGFRYQADKREAGATGRWVGADGRASTPGQLNEALERGKTGGPRLAMYPDRDPITGQPTLPGNRRRRGILEGGAGGGVPRGGVNSGDAFKALYRHIFGGSDDSSRTDQENPDPSGPVPLDVPPDNIPKQVPPFPADPPPDPGKDKEEFDADESRPFVLPGAEPVEGRPGVFIFPDLSDELNKPSIIWHKGDDRTRDFNEIVRDWFLTPEKEAEGWEHVAGGRERPGIGHNSKDLPGDDQSSAEESPATRGKKEEWISNPMKDFEKEVFKERVDGRKGSNFVDLTFRNESTDEEVRVQTVDVDKNGNPTQRELDAAWSIWKRTQATVILIKKPWQ